MSPKLVTPLCVLVTGINRKTPMRELLTSQDLTLVPQISVISKLLSCPPICTTFNDPWNCIKR